MHLAHIERTRNKCYYSTLDILPVQFSITCNCLYSTVLFHGLLSMHVRISSTIISLVRVRYCKTFHSHSPYEIYFVVSMQTHEMYMYTYTTMIFHNCVLKIFFRLSMILPQWILSRHLLEIGHLILLLLFCVGIIRKSASLSKRSSSKSWVFCVKK